MVSNEKKLKLCLIEIKNPREALMICLSKKSEILKARISLDEF